MKLNSFLWLGALELQCLVACTPVPDESHCWDSSDEPVAVDGSTVRIQGRAQRQDGSPLRGHVLLEEPPTLGELLTAALTLGLSCLKEDLSGLDCTDYQQLALDAEGRFAHQMPEDNTQGSLGFDRTFLLFAGLPAAADGLAQPALVAWARFRKQLVALPDLVLWEPTLTLSAADERLRVRLDPPPSLACTAQQELALDFRDAAERTVWSQAVADLDPRVLEDTRGTVRARVRLDNEAMGAQVDSVELYSAAQTFAGSAGAPPSRGAACEVGGQAYPSACPLTDGAFESVSAASGAASVDLGAARPLALLVLRGAFAALTVSSSLDGQTWTELGTGLQGSSLRLAPAGAPLARHLRLQEARDAQGQQRALQITELSAW
jgi:hypothetical protein